MPSSEIKELDSFVREGYFKSRNEAVQRAVDLLIFDIKRSSKARENAVKSVREIREKMWQECLKEAKGNEDLAWDILYKRYCN